MKHGALPTDEDRERLASILREAADDIEEGSTTTVSLDFLHFAPGEEATVNIEIETTLSKEVQELL